jgi:hypothetical protein
VLAFLPFYYATLDKVARSQVLALNNLDVVTADAKGDQEKATLAQYREKGWVQHGTTVLAAVKTTGVDLTSNSSERPTVHVLACIDVKNVSELDKSGRSVTTKARANYFVENLTVVNIDYPSSSGWRVTAAPNKGAASCAGV